MDTKDNFLVPEEVAEWIGLKKSEYLSELIQLALPGDFDFAEYHQFNHLVPETIQDADRVFQSSADQFELRTFVKSYSLPTHLHQVVIAVMLPDLKTKDLVLVPILCFVTRKDELAKKFSVGKLISRPTLN